MIKLEELEEFESRISHYSCIGAKLDILKLVNEIRHLNEILTLRYPTNNFDISTRSSKIVQAFSSLSRTGSQNQAREALKAFDEIMLYKHSAGFESGAGVMREIIASQIESDCESPMIFERTVKRYCGTCENCELASKARQTVVPFEALEIQEPNEE